MLIAPILGIPLGILLVPVAHFFPPPSPMQSAEWFHGFFADNLLGVRLGGIAIMLFAILFGFFSGGLITLARAIEGAIAPWTNVLIVISAVVVAAFFLSGVFFCTATLRPDRPAESLYLLSDLAWITLIIPGFAGGAQAFAFALAVLQDDRDTPILPRWTWYLSAWYGMVSLPGGFCGMFLSGPFAWNGVLAFYLPMTLFTIWMGGVAWVTCSRVNDSLLASPRGRRPAPALEGQ